MSPVLRSAVSTDAPALAAFNVAMALETESIHLDPATTLAGVKAALADPHKAMYFIAEIDGHPAAQVMITHEWSDWRNGGIWWIQSVYVHPDHRRKGLFRMLYAHVVKLARQQGVIGIRLYVEHENRSAQRTYESLGMHTTHYLVMEEIFSASSNPQ